MVFKRMCGLRGDTKIYLRQDEDFVAVHAHPTTNSKVLIAESQRWETPAFRTRDGRLMSPAIAEDC